ncbi:MAG: hypothetical protein AB1411_16015 [Nitrospirota bacterium]
MQTRYFTREQDLLSPSALASFAKEYLGEYWPKHSSPAPEVTVRQLSSMTEQELIPLLPALLPNL